MSIYNSLKTKFNQYNLFFPTILVGLFITLLPNLFSVPFGDDYVYIFNNSHITQTSNPFVFWNLNSDSYKSWPLTYSIFWILYRFLGEHFFIYRIVNIIIHFATGIVFLKFLNQYSFKNKKLFFFLFIFNPLSIESIFWIFQLKTLLSTFFIFLSVYQWKKFNDLKSPANFFQSLIYFVASLSSKSIGIFIPFIMLFMKSSPRQKILVIPFFVISLYSGMESIKGITNSFTQKVKIETYQDRYFQEPSQYEQKVKKITESRLIEFQQMPLVEKLSIKKESYFEKVIKNFNIYFNKATNKELLLTKITIISSSFIFYLKSTFGMSSYSFVYPNFNFFDFYNYLYLVLMIGIFSSLLYASYQARLYFFLAYILFLPISGLFYVPYMEFSYVANHWFYPSYGFIIALLVVGLQKIKNIQTKRLLTFSIATLIFFQFINLSFSLRSTKDYFYKNLALNPSSTILYEYLIEIEKKDSNYSQALYLAEELLHFTENKLPVIDTLIQISSNMDTKLYRKFVLLKSKIALKLGNIVLAKDALREFPFKENDKDYLFYNSIFELITKKSITEEQSISIKKFLLE